jgi:hypothetical protein
MSSFMRRATAATVVLLSVGWGASVPVSASPGRVSAAAPSQPTAAQTGAGWLGRQFTGPFIATSGKANASFTTLAVLALAAAGVGRHQARAGIGWLEKNYQAYVSPGGVDDAGALAAVILAAQAMGTDPTAFGRKTPTNLVTRLEATQRTTGSDAGLFGSSDPTFDGAFRQGLALMALANRGVSNPAGVTWLRNQQCGDGGWESYRSDLTTACPAPDPSTFAGPDTNSTALAVEGLVAAGATFPTSPVSFF